MYTLIPARVCITLASRAYARAFAREGLTNRGPSYPSFKSTGFDASPTARSAPTTAPTTAPDAAPTTLPMRPGFLDFTGTSSEVSPARERMEAPPGDSGSSPRALGERISCND
jgi:hypothetical protein